MFETHSTSRRTMSGNSGRRHGGGSDMKQLFTFHNYTLRIWLKLFIAGNNYNKVPIYNNVYIHTHEDDICYRNNSLYC